MDWPSDLAPLVAAALDHPRAGIVVYCKQLQVVHATGKLGNILGLLPSLLSPESAPPHLLLITLLGSSSLFDDATVKYAVEMARPGMDQESVLLPSLDGKRTIGMEVRRIGPHYWAASFEDVTTRRQSESRLLDLALRDPLTGLGNRTHFETTVAAALKVAVEHPVAIFFIDLDRFKVVNDTLGHAVGDSLLRLVGQRLQSVLRTGDTVARLGGDEFAVLIAPSLTPAELGAFAARIVNLLQRTYVVGGHVANVGASIGIAIAPQDGEVLDRLLKSADLALYHSKEQHRGTYHFFDPAMEAKVQSRRNTELELRKALPLRQIEVHYLPLRDVATGKLTSFEPVLRWKHPENGWMEATAFMPLAEEIGLAPQIEDWMLRTACRDATGWAEPTPITFSVSRSQFESGRLLNTVENSLASTSIPGHRLELEITESVLLDNDPSVLDTLFQLRAMGVRITMDHFGTGYASLTQLVNFPFDKVKIHRSLTADGPGSAKHRAILKAILNLGANLGMATVAEGVESAEDLYRIHSEGCIDLLGCATGDPIAANQISKIFASSQELAEVNA